MTLIDKRKLRDSKKIEEEMAKIYNEYIPPDVTGESKSKVRTLVLAILLGIFGVHNFYLGNNNKAMVQLILSVIGGFMTYGITTIIVAIWVIVEIILIATGRINKDADLRPIE